jgi:hypothetical protein
VRLKPAAFGRFSLGSHLASARSDSRHRTRRLPLLGQQAPRTSARRAASIIRGEVLGIRGHTYASARSDVVKMGSIADNLDSYASSTWMTKNSRNSRP